jgi:hypothetical protein
MRAWGIGLVLGLLAWGVWAQERPEHPDVSDFWEGRAVWVQEFFTVGLPVGESDTVDMGGGVLWSYLHASHQSAGVIDQCGEPVAFPGCLTRWESTDNGKSFSLPIAMCLLPCLACPCDDQRDHITTQQYPRVVFTPERYYMAYEWHAQTMLRTSQEGTVWSAWEYLRVPIGTWNDSYAPCTEVERIGAHPHIRGQADNCQIGGPPGIYVEGDMLYIFVTAGSAPSHLRCYKGNRFGDLRDLQLCEHDPLFGGAREYGDPALRGADANAYFDFRYVSSADVIRARDGRYYAFYEGIRGPDVLERGMDSQYALALARSVAGEIDDVWEKFPDNPILGDLDFNWGIGHADVIILDDGITYLYTATSQTTRGRYKLVWAQDAP